MRLVRNGRKQNLLTVDSGIPENGCKFSLLALSLVTGLMDLWYGQASAISYRGSNRKSSKLCGHSICSILPLVSERQEREVGSNCQVRECQVSTHLIFVTNNTAV